MHAAAKIAAQASGKSLNQWAADATGRAASEEGLRPSHYKPLYGQGRRPLGTCSEVIDMARTLEQLIDSECPGIFSRAKASRYSPSTTAG